MLTSENTLTVLFQLLDQVCLYVSEPFSELHNQVQMGLLHLPEKLKKYSFLVKEFPII